MNTYAQKLAAALEFLGTSWVLHPDYRPELHPKHTVTKWRA